MQSISFAPNYVWNCQSIRKLSTCTHTRWQMNEKGNFKRKETNNGKSFVARRRAYNILGSWNWHISMNCMGENIPKSCWTRATDAWIRGHMPEIWFSFFLFILIALNWCRLRTDGRTHKIFALILHFNFAHTRTRSICVPCFVRCLAVARDEFERRIDNSKGSWKMREHFFRSAEHISGLFRVYYIFIPSDVQRKVRTLSMRNQIKCFIVENLFIFQYPSLNLFGLISI